FHVILPPTQNTAPLPAWRGEEKRNLEPELSRGGTRSSQNRSNLCERPSGSVISPTRCTGVHVPRERCRWCLLGSDRKFHGRLPGGWRASNLCWRSVGRNRSGSASSELARS